VHLESWDRALFTYGHVSLVREDIIVELVRKLVSSTYCVSTEETKLPDHENEGLQASLTTRVKWRNHTRACRLEELRRVVVVVLHFTRLVS
jgi:hypothetical protein